MCIRDRGKARVDVFQHRPQARAVLPGRLFPLQAGKTPAQQQAQPRNRLPHGKFIARLFRRHLRKGAGERGAGLPRLLRVKAVRVKGFTCLLYTSRCV